MTFRRPYLTNNCVKESTEDLKKFVGIAESSPREDRSGREE